MNWFKDIPEIFKLILLLIALVSFLIFFKSIDFTNIGEVTDKTTNFITEQATPTEVSWLSTAVNKIKNPYLLLFVVTIILWLLDYFSNGRR